MSTPLKSSLKSSNSKRIPEPPVRRDQTSDADSTAASDREALPSLPRLSLRVASGTSPIKKHFENLEVQPRERVPSSIYSLETRGPDHGQPRSRAIPTATQIPSAGYDQSGQRGIPSRVGVYGPEDNQLRPRPSPTSNETSRSWIVRPRNQETPTRGETYRRGYDQSRPLSTSASIETPKPKTEYRPEHAGNEWSHRCTSASSSTSDRRSVAMRVLTQVEGLPDRNTQQPSCDLDPLIAYQAGADVKTLKAPSTMRSQPKMPLVHPKVAAEKLRSSVWRTSSRGSTGMGSLSENEHVKKSRSGYHPEGTALNQMDGATDFIISMSSSRGSFIDLRSEFERRDMRDGQISYLPIFTSRSQPRAVLTKKNGQSRKLSWASPHKSPPGSTFTGRDGIKPGANKVMGLAAMFDTAAKASPFVPTPGGAVQKRPRETARVISPYTSNPSPRASLQSVASVSTPVSLMSPTRLSIHFCTPAANRGRKSMIPRLQNPSAMCSTFKTERHMSPSSVLRRDESLFSLNSSKNPSRQPTPSRLPVRKISTNESLRLPQLDDLSSTKQSLLKLTTQQEIRPVGVYSSPVPQTKVIGGYKGNPQLSPQSARSIYSDSIGYSEQLTSLNQTQSRGRSISSLRDQIRSLRTELSAKNEDCAQLRLDLEKSYKMKEVNEMLLGKDVDRAKSEAQKWRRRAERAERKVDKYERPAMQFKDARDHSLGRNTYHPEKQGDKAEDYSFTSGSDHLDTSDRAVSQPLTAGMNQSVTRTSVIGVNGADSMGTGDGFSECSSSTVVRNIVTPDENDPSSGGGLWSAANKLVDVMSPGRLEEIL